MSSDFSRREFIAGATAAALFSHAPCGAASAGQSAGQPLHEFDYAEVRLTGGPLKRQHDRVRAAYLALDNDRLLKVYRERAGLPAPGADMGGWYDAGGFVPGHSLGQYISGLSRFGRATGDQACHAKAGELVEGFAATLGAADRVFAGPNAEKVWPCYILDKHLAGLIDAWQLCGIAQARELLPRIYNGAQPYIPERGRDRVGKMDPPYDETYVLPETLFAAHAITGDGALYDRAIAYLLDREFFDPLARGEDVLPGRHAYSHAIALSSAGKAHLVLGDEKYLSAMKHAWELLTTTQQYASGGWGPNETFITPHRGELYESLHATDDHFETPCGSYAAMKLARYLLCATGDARYGDGLERVVYNTILGVKEPDGEGDFPYYSTYGPRARKVYYSKKWPCCSGTLVECVADYVKNLYFRAADGIAVNVYAPSECSFIHNGSTIRLNQETNYPLEESIALHVECSRPAEFALRLRIPEWLHRPAMIRVNGRVAAAETHRGFAVVRRRWRTGDTVTLELPMSFRTEAIDDFHPETVAAMRGPVLYVALNPAPGTALPTSLDSLEPASGMPGVFLTRTSRGEAQLAPFHSVRGESYTTYFDKS